MAGRTGFSPLPPPPLGYAAIERGANYSWELPLPKHFEEAARIVTEETVASRVVCGPDPDAHLAKLCEFADARFDHVCVHQVGPDQEGFFGFYTREILPRIR